MKQIFDCISQENISTTEMLGYQHNRGRAFVDSFFYGGMSLLTIAAKNGHAQVCEYLIKYQQANVETRMTFKGPQNTALIDAAYHNHVDVVKLLVDYDANIKAKNIIGEHAAYRAAYNGHLDCLKILVEKNEDVVNLKGAFGGLPLTAAVTGRKDRKSIGEVDIVEYLLSISSTDVNARDGDGETALHHAAKENKLAIVNMLLSSGAKNLRNYRNENPLDIAKFKKHEKIVQKLEEHFS